MFRSPSWNLELSQDAQELVAGLHTSSSFPSNPKFAADLLRQRSHIHRKAQKKHLHYLTTMEWKVPHGTGEP